VARETWARGAGRGRGPRAGATGEPNSRLPSRWRGADEVVPCFAQACSRPGQVLRVSMGAGEMWHGLTSAILTKSRKVPDLLLRDAALKMGREEKDRPRPPRPRSSEPLRLRRRNPSTSGPSFAENVGLDRGQGSLERALLLPQRQDRRHFRESRLRTAAAPPPPSTAPPTHRHPSSVPSPSPLRSGRSPRALAPRPRPRMAAGPR
jgi:hypothetical protein